MKAKGFTLLEFIIYFALIAIVVTTITLFAVDVVKSRAKAVAIAEVEQNMRFGLQRVQRAVRQASKLDVGASTLNSDAGVLSLDMAATSTTPTVFDLSDGALRMKVGSGAFTPVTSPDVRVTKLRFSKDNAAGNGVAVTTEIALEYDTDNPDVLFRYAASATATAVIRKD